MSRVTIKELYWEIDRDTYANNVWNGYKDIEIVPRRIAEMIIERCSISEKLVNKTTAMEVRDIRNYAESLLEQFEEEKLTNGKSVASLQDNGQLAEPGRTMTTEQIIDHLRYEQQELSEARGLDYSGVIALEEAIKELSSVLDKQKVFAMLDFADNALTDEVRTVENFKALLVECIKVMPTSRSTGK